MCLITGPTYSLSIADVQGSGHTSPYLGQQVTIEGVVTQTVDAVSGFFIQSEQADNNPNTSEAVFVYTGRRGHQVNTGDLVRIRGTVDEYDGQTQITRPNLIQLIGQRALPAPQPLRDISQAESQESMRVLSAGSVSNLYQLSRYGSVELSNGYWLDDNQFSTRPELSDWQLNVRLQQSLANSPAILVHRFGEYRLFAQAVELVGNPRPPAPDKPQGAIRLVVSNLFNFFNGEQGSFSSSRGPNTSEQWQRQLAKTSKAINQLQPDILVVSEAENDFHTANSALSELASATGLQLVNSRQRTGEDAIAVNILYKPSTIALTGSAIYLTDLDTRNRVPMAQRFTSRQGGSLLLSAQHWKSKRCNHDDCGKTARFNAAQAVSAWLKNEADVLVAGDLNSYYGDPAWQYLVEHGWQTLLTESDYTYHYRGRFGALDHVFSRNLDNWTAVTHIWHINADEAPWRSYQAVNAPLDATRYSDHDPIIIDLFHH